MELTLERWRWLPGEYQHSPIVVNIPEFQLRAYDDHFNVAVTMKVVVGRALGHDTPIFMNQMRYVIFRPYWNVPESIARAEWFRESNAIRTILPEENMEVVDSRENVVGTGPVSADMLERVREGRLSVQQAPRPKEFFGARQVYVPQRIQCLHARYAGHGTVLEIKA